MSDFSQPMQDAFNTQINNELTASYSYLAMSAYLEAQQFLGCAQWMRMQSQEEYSHAMRLYDFLIARGGRAKLAPIGQPQIDFESVPHVFECSQEQEKKVTAQINEMYGLALSEKSYAALGELDWFVKEQVEEEKTIRDIVHKFNLVKDDPASLLDLDRDLGERKEDDEGDD